MKLGLKAQIQIQNKVVSAEVVGYNIRFFDIVELDNFDRESFQDLLELVFALGLPYINKTVLKDNTFTIPNDIAKNIKDISVKFKKDYINISGMVDWENITNLINIHI